MMEYIYSTITTAQGAKQLWYHTRCLIYRDFFISCEVERLSVWCECCVCASSIENGPTANLYWTFFTWHWQYISFSSKKMSLKKYAVSSLISDAWSKNSTQSYVHPALFTFYNKCILMTKYL